LTESARRSLSSISNIRMNASHLSVLVGF